MEVEARLLRRSDVSQIVTGWNLCLPYDRISRERFESIIFDDPNYEREGNLVATWNDKIVGFIAAVAREGTAGLDGAGKVHEEDFGYIKGLFVLKVSEGEGIKRCLLEKALRFLKSKAKKIARVGEYTGRYFSPGIDIRYEEELRFFLDNGFEKVDVEEDVTIDLNAFQPTEYQRQAQQRIELMGVAIKSYQTKFLDEMRCFAEKLDYPQWFPKDWELHFNENCYTLVAVSKSDIVGWARFFKDSERWWFGPIAVLKEFRRKGIGTCLLLEAMLQMKTVGASNVTAGWADVPFYLKSNWKISRRYIVLQKSLIGLDIKCMHADSKNSFHHVPNLDLNQRRT